MRLACENIQYFLIGLDHHVIQYHQCIVNVFDFVRLGYALTKIDM